MLLELFKYFAVILFLGIFEQYLKIEMKKVFFVLTIPVALWFMGCQSVNKTESGKATVSVSILPQKYIVDRLSDNTIEVNVMVPPGTSPEMYEPSPIQMKDVSNSSVYFAVGPLEFEGTILPRIKELNPNIRFVNLSDGLNLIEGHNHHEIMGEHNHAACYDPHIWTSTKEFKQMASGTCKELCNAFPDKKDSFLANLEKLHKEVDALDSMMRKVVETAETQKFLIYHPALSYFAREYGLSQIAIEEDGKNPSAQHLTQLVQLAKAEKLHSVFIQSQFDSRNAEMLSMEIGGDVITIDPLGYDWITIMTDLKNKMAKALRSKVSEQGNE